MLLDGGFWPLDEDELGDWVLLEPERGFVRKYGGKNDTERNNGQTSVSITYQVFLRLH